MVIVRVGDSRSVNEIPLSEIGLPRHVDPSESFLPRSPDMTSFVLIVGCALACPRVKVKLPDVPYTYYINSTWCVNPGPQVRPIVSFLALLTPCDANDFLTPLGSCNAAQSPGIDLAHPGSMSAPRVDALKVAVLCEMVGSR